MILEIWGARIVRRNSDTPFIGHTKDNFHGSHPKTTTFVFEDQHHRRRCLSIRTGHMYNTISNFSSTLALSKFDVFCNQLAKKKMKIQTSILFNLAEKI